MKKMKRKNGSPVLKTDCEARFKIKLADDKIVGKIDGWVMSTETHEEKLERLGLDILKKKYPVFSHMEDIIEKAKSRVKIYNNDIMSEVSLDFASLLKIKRIAKLYIEQ